MCVCGGRGSGVCVYCVILYLHMYMHLLCVVVSLSAFDWASVPYAITFKWPYYAYSVKAVSHYTDNMHILLITFYWLPFNVKHILHIPNTHLTDLVYTEYTKYYIEQAMIPYWWPLLNPLLSV
jgi:hypothetical protein